MKLRKVIVDCTKCKSNKQRVYTRYKSGFHFFMTRKEAEEYNG